MNSRKIISLSIAVLSLLAASTQAGTVKLTDRPGSPGGEFLATVIDPTGISGHQAGSTFVTFCLEKTEYISFNTVYDVVVSGAAQTGGGGSVNGKDDLDARTAYLYTQFRNGTLLGYDYVASSTANHLQSAIWFLEQEITSVSGQALTWVNQAQFAVDNDVWTEGLGQVRVMNLSRNGSPAQDQLILVPLPTMSLAGLALLVGLGVFRIRRFRRRAGLV